MEDSTKFIHDKLNLCDFNYLRSYKAIESSKLMEQGNNLDYCIHNCFLSFSESIIRNDLLLGWRSFNQ